jgi:hypothetical protein
LTGGGSCPPVRAMYDKAALSARAERSDLPLFIMSPHPECLSCALTASYIIQTSLSDSAGQGLTPLAGAIR